MNSYFSATEIHLDDRCLLDATPAETAPVLVTLGTDNMVYRLNAAEGSEERYNLEEGSYDAIALSPDGTHCLLGGKGNALLRFTFADSAAAPLLDTLGSITAIRYAPNGAYVAVGSQEGKTIIYDPLSARKEKCRPGHTGAVCSIALSKSGALLASIGTDQNLLVYRISLEQQPVELARYPVSRLEDCSELSCSFHPNEQVLFSGGEARLQRLECVENRWEHSFSSSIQHSSEMLMVQVVKPNTLVTSSAQEVCVWSIREEERLYVIEEFSLLRVVPLRGGFFGTRNDGKLYEYQRQLREQEPMDVEQEAGEDAIRFEEEGEGEEGEEEVQVEEREVEYHQHKKSKADKMIKVFPQPLLSNATQPFEGSRFLFVNLYGCVIERQEGDEEAVLEVELSGRDKEQKFLLRSNSYTAFAINEMGVLFGSDKELCFRPSARGGSEEWSVEWGVEAVALGAGWAAAANDSQIKVFDMAGHEIRCIAFDRPLVALRAHENVLLAAYHESVPLWEAQQLAMSLFLVTCSRGELAPVAHAHLPLKRTALLAWLDFSQEGMLFSQDSAGEMRAFSLESNEWTAVCPDSADSAGKCWPIGVRDYKLLYWKTTKTDPEPTVAPRFEAKLQEFSIPTVGSHPEGTQEKYEKLLWRRYALDHEKARSRLWGSLKIRRGEKSLFSALSDSLLAESEIARRHCALDEEYVALVLKYVKARETLRGMFVAQSCLRSEEAARKVVELLDYENQRQLAIRFEQHCDQLRQEQDYEKQQVFSFVKLREEAERSIKPRAEDPMKRAARKAEALPSFSQSFMMSQESDLSELNASKLSQQSENEAENPFLRRKSNHESLEAKKKEISEQIERFGTKQKADRRPISKPAPK